jgi:hypothetical protein
MSHAQIYTDQVFAVPGERKHAGAWTQATCLKLFFLENSPRDERFDVFGNGAFIDLQTLGDLAACDRLGCSDQPQDQPAFGGEVEIALSK